MTADEIIETARQAGFWKGQVNAWMCTTEDLVAFAKLVAAKATDEANARSNTSWTLMCKKMVEDEREVCAAVADWCIQNHLEQHIPELIRSRGATTLRGEA